MVVTVVVMIMIVIMVMLMMFAKGLLIGLRLFPLLDNYSAPKQQGQKGFLLLLGLVSFSTNSFSRSVSSLKILALVVIGPLFSLMLKSKDLPSTERFC
jgi:hypothetical protein